MALCLGYPGTTTASEAVTSRRPADIPPSLHEAEEGAARPEPAPAVGWTATLRAPPRVDHRRRIPRTGRPQNYGSSLKVGEAFRYDLMFAGNPAGIAEARITAYQLDPRGAPPTGAPTVRLDGHAQTSGIVSLLATVTDDMVTIVDAQTGATVSSVSTINYSGLSPVKFRHRVTQHLYHGRGYLQIIDTKDDDTVRKSRLVPLDTFDALSAMAWVRSLPLEEGQKAKAHVVDGQTLMRFEVESKGHRRLDAMPTVATALGIDSDQAILLEGVLTRVDRFDQPVPGKRSFEMRAWLSGDDRRLPLVLESDMWVGAVRLTLTGYDPPSGATTPGAGPRDASAQAAANEARHAPSSP